LLLEPRTAYLIYPPKNLGNVEQKGMSKVILLAAAVLCALAMMPSPAAGGEQPPGPAVISSPVEGTVLFVNEGIEFTSDVLNSSTFGEPVDFIWDFGDGNSSTEINPNHIYSSGGNYTIRLSVTDDEGALTVSEVNITLLFRPLPEVQIVIPSHDPGEYLAQSRLDFSVQGLLMISGPDNISYSWDFGDGTVMTGPAPVHAYAGPGTYNVTVTISDGHSRTQDTLQLIVKARPPVAVDGSRALYAWFAVSVVLAAGVCLFLGGTEIGLGLLAPVFIFLYSKIKRDQILDNYTRGQIHGYILANPGEHYNSIKSALDLNNGTLAYHLNRLEQENIIKSRPDGLFKRFYPASMKMPEPNGSALTEVQRSIISKIKETPGISQRDIASLMKLSNATVNYHLERLLKKGTVRRERAGMRKRCYLTEEGFRELEGREPAPPADN
jgi:predicted transcriptional regulator